MIEEFIKAIDRNDMVKLKRILKEENTVNVQTDLKNYEETIEQANNAALNYLLSDCRHSQHETLKIFNLITEVNKTSNFCAAEARYKALMHAQQVNNIKAVKILLADKFTLPSLKHNAFFQNIVNPEILDVVLHHPKLEPLTYKLIGRGIPAVDSHSPLEYVISNDKTEILKRWLKKYPTNGALTKNLSKYTIILAAKLNKPQVIKTIWKKNPDIISIDLLIDKAVAQDSKDVLSLLLKKISPTIFDWNKTLNNAALLGKVKAAALLLQDPHASYTQSSAEALVNAAENGHSTLIELLLKDGRKILLDQIYSAINKAKKHNHPLIVEQLLMHNQIDPNKIDYASLYEWATQNHYDNIVALLLEKTYALFLANLHRMILEEPLPQAAKHIPPASEKLKYQTIFNNHCYESTLAAYGITTQVPDNPNFIEGKPLVLNNLNTPIGYNLHLPEKPVKDIVMMVYGGGADNGCFGPQDINALSMHLLSQGIGVILLNLPDVLKLEAPQYLMPKDLCLEMHSCIHHAFNTILNQPHLLHPSLTSRLDPNVKLHLFGQSFGGGLIVRHAQEKPNTFKSYISHHGDLDMKMTFNLGQDDAYADQDGHFQYEAYLDPSEKENMEKIIDPLLIMQNAKDLNVNCNVATYFNKRMLLLNKKNVQLYVYNDSDAVQTNYFFKNHGIPTSQKSFEQYCNVLVKFIQRGLFQSEEVRRVEGFFHNAFAQEFYKGGSLAKRFVGKALNIFDKKTLSDLNLKKLLLSNNRGVKSYSDQAWEEELTPLFNAMYYAHKSANPTKTVFLNQEIERLNGLLTDDGIATIVNSHFSAFKEYISSFGVKLNSEFDQQYPPNHSSYIYQFRKALLNLPQQKQSLIESFLTMIYIHNEALLQAHYPQMTQEGQYRKELNKNKLKLTQTLNQGKLLLTYLYEANQHNNFTSSTTLSKRTGSIITKLK